MDDKFLNNDDSLDTADNEEMVLFSRDDSEEAIEKVNDTTEEISEEVTEEAVESGETAETEETVETENAETESDEAEDKPVVEKKVVAAPKKTKSEKTQTVLFFVVIALGIIAFIILLVAGIVTMAKKYGVFDKINEMVNQTEETTDAIEVEEDVSKVQYSLYLEDNGFIKDVKAGDYVEICDYKNIVIDYADIKPEDSEVQEQIDNALASFESLDKETDKVTETGDTLNIDYVGTIDGVAFEGGDTKGQGAELTLGSGSYIDDFEDQLVGYKVGDKVTVEVTFPENYGNEELNGKDAVFEVVINGIYVTPEFNDEFVKTNLSSYASTADEYRAYIESALADNNKVTYLWDYVNKNSVVTEYPEEYLQNEYEVYTLEMQSQYEYYNNYYYSMMGQYMWNNIYEFYEVEEAGYDDLVKKNAEDSTKQSLIIQAIAEDAGIEATEEDMLAYLTEIGYSSSSYETIAEKYGQGYIYQQTLYSMVEDLLLENSTVNK